MTLGLCLAHDSYAQYWEWANGAYATTRANGFNVAADGIGNCYITGLFRDTVDFDGIELISPGDYFDPFLAKYDTSGNLKWAINQGTTELNCLESFEGIALYEASIYVAGRTETHCLLKYDTSGTFIWGNNVSQCNVRSHDVVVDGNGDVIVTGYYQASVTFGAITLNEMNNARNPFVTKYDSLGNVIWATSFASNESASGRSIAVDAENNVYVLVEFADSLYVENQLLTSTGGGDFDPALVKMNAAGNVSWIRTGYGPEGDYGTCVELDNTGNIYISGYSEDGITFGNLSLVGSGTGNAFLTKYSPDGQVIWAKLSADGLASGNAIIADAYGSVVMAGHYVGQVSFDTVTVTSVGYDGYIVQYDSSGVITAFESSSGAGSEYFRGITQSGLGTVIVTGWFESHAQFGTIELPSTFDESVMTAQFNWSLPASYNDVELVPSVGFTRILLRTIPQSV